MLQKPSWDGTISYLEHQILPSHIVCNQLLKVQITVAAVKSTVLITSQNSGPNYDTTVKVEMSS